MRAVQGGLVAILVAVSAAAIAQTATPFGYQSAATTNSTLVKTGAGQVTTLTAINTTTSPYVLKLYDKATAPTCGTDTPKWRLPIPATTSAGVLAVPLQQPIAFINGIGFCITAGLPDTDVSPSALGVMVNFGIK